MVPREGAPLVNTGEEVGSKGRTRTYSQGLISKDLRGEPHPSPHLKNGDAAHHRDFLRVLNAWPELSAPIRAAILALVETSLAHKGGAL